jgi:ribosomal protein S27AE
MRRWYRENADKARGWAARYRAANLEAVRAYDRARGRRAADPQKEKARNAVRHAIDHGRLTRQPCEICGAATVEAHHDDYARPLDVRWLCRRHHGHAHRRVGAGLL